MFNIAKKMTVLVMIVVLLTGVVALAVAGGSSESSKSDSGMEPMAKKSTAPMTDGGRQVEFTSLSNAQAFAKEGPVVLYFSASWCPTCKAAEKDLKNNAKVLASDVTVVKVNYDTSAELKTKYGVTMQHTFVQIDGNGNKLAIWNGGAVAKINESVKRM